VIRLIILASAKGGNSNICNIYVNCLTKPAICRIIDFDRRVLGVHSDIRRDMTAIITRRRIRSWLLSRDARAV
jgi:hypothetical protein